MRRKLTKGYRNAGCCCCWLPQRAERLGWMGDAYTSGETQLHNFDLAGAYESFLSQIEDNQVCSTFVCLQIGIGFN